MTEYFRVTGLNDIVFDGAPSTRNYDINGIPEGMSEPLTREEVLSVVDNLPLEIRGHALGRGLSIITVPFQVWGTSESDSDLEDNLHDIHETLEDAKLYIATQGAQGTRTEFQFQLDGATQSSYKTVYWGKVDEQEARTVFDSEIRCARMEGLKRPETAVTLGPNEIYCPSFEEDCNGDNLADTWSQRGAGPVFGFETTIALHSCHSQKITSANAAEGIESANIVAPAGVTEAVAYAWVCRPAAGSDIRATLRDTSLNISRDTALLSAATVTATGKSGQTWYRLDLSSNAIVPANNHELWLEATAAGATVWYVDKCFWLWGTTTRPDEWIDHWLIYSHYDTTEGAAHENHINYVDTDDLKGDVDARLLMRVEFEQKADEDYARDLICGRRTRPIVCNFTWWMEAEDRDGVSNWATVAEAGCSAGNKVRDAGVNAAGYVRWQIDVVYGNVADHFGRFDVFGVVSTDDPVNTSYRMYWDVGGIRAYNRWVWQSNTSKWELVYLGTVDPVPFIRSGIDPVRYAIFVEYQKQAADTAELDVIWLVPKDEPEMRLDPPSSDYITVGQWWAEGQDEDFNYLGLEQNTPPIEWIEPPHLMGQHMTLVPRKENRLYLSCTTFDVTDDVWEAHGAATDLQMIVNIDYLAQYISPME